MNLNLGNTQVIISEAKKAGLLRNELAYLLATTYHETGMKMTPVTENLNYSASGLRKTFPKYFTEAQAKAYERQPERIANRAYANRIGNGSEASGDGWKYRGRGYVQITGRANYKTYGIENTPEKALDAAYAAHIAIDGMVHGRFTGKKFSDYINLQKSDFEGARRIINGTDKAADIAKYAREYDADLKKIGYGEGKVETAPKPTPVAPEKPAESVHEDNATNLVSLVIKLLKALFGRK